MTSGAEPLVIENRDMHVCAVQMIWGQNLLYTVIFKASQICSHYQGSRLVLFCVVLLNSCMYPVKISSCMIFLWLAMNSGSMLTKHLF